MRQTLRERGLNPLEVVPVADKPASPLSRRGLSTTQVALFTRQLATLLGAGLPIDEALAALGEQGEDERARSLVVALRSRVMEGAGLATAFADYPESFPEIYRASVAAGEQSGRLSTVLERLADYAESRDALRTKMLAALAYPLLLTFVAVCVVTGLLVYVVPQIVGVFASMKQELPLPTTVLIGLSEFVKRWGIVLFGAIVVLLFSARFALRRRCGAHELASLAAASAVDRQAHARVEHGACGAHARAAQCGARCSLLDALAISAQVVPNLPMREALSAPRTRCAKVARSRALADSGYFPPVAVRLIASGERSASSNACSTKRQRIRPRNSTAGSRC